MDNKREGFDFAEFVRQNRKKIIISTPKNPKLKRDDEWVDETEWDECNDHLKKSKYEQV